jgi:hypothetical protein
VTPLASWAFLVTILALFFLSYLVGVSRGVLRERDRLTRLAEEWDRTANREQRRAAARELRRKS